MQDQTALDAASALLAAYNFYPDKFMEGTKPDPSEMAVLTGLLHGMDKLLQEHPTLRDDAKHPRDLDELKRMHRISYGMSRSRFQRALSTLHGIAGRLVVSVEKYETLQALNMERDLNGAYKHFLHEDFGDRG